jgi:hypothetical protein
MEAERIISEKNHTKKKYSESEKAEYCEAWKRSSKSMSEFCRHNDLSFQTFYGWVNREKKLSRELFIPVDTGIERGNKGENLKVKFRNGCEVYFSDIKDESKIIKLLEGLRDVIAHS